MAVRCRVDERGRRQVIRGAVGVVIGHEISPGFDDVVVIGGDHNGPVAAACLTE